MKMVIVPAAAVLLVGLAQVVLAEPPGNPYLEAIRRRTRGGMGQAVLRRP